MPTIKDGVAAAGVVVDAVKVVAETEEGKAAVKELGKSAVIVAEAIHNALLPIAALNFGMRKAKQYFEEQFVTDMAAKAGAIPPNDIVEPKASIAGPALQGLAFSFEEPNLKDMYLNLLKSTMDRRTVGAVHPAFVDVIRQITSEEAEVLSIYLKSGIKGNNFQIAELRLTERSTSYYEILHKHLLNPSSNSTGKAAEIPGIIAMIDNFIRLGLVEVNYSLFSTDKDAYGWVEKRPEYIRFKSERETDTHEVTFQKGLMIRTAFGNQFAKAAGI